MDTVSLAIKPPDQSGIEIALESALSAELRLMNAHWRGRNGSARDGVAFQYAAESDQRLAVLPTLHLNGFRISNPTVLSRIEPDELGHLLHYIGKHGKDLPEIRNWMWASGHDRRMPVERVRA